jgi:phage N-6-adenine-methyltransferase
MKWKPGTQNLWQSSARTGEKSQDAWGTPRGLFEYLHASYRFDLDGAAVRDNTLLPKYNGPDNGRDAMVLANWLLHDDGTPTRSIYANPPYSHAADFFRMAHTAIEARRTPHRTLPRLVVVMLVFARTDTKYWWRYVLGRDDDGEPAAPGASAILWKKGRLQFVDPATDRPRRSASGQVQSAPAPSVAVVFDSYAPLEDWPENGVLSWP